MAARTIHVEAPAVNGRPTCLVVNGGRYSSEAVSRGWTGRATRSRSDGRNAMRIGIIGSGLMGGKLGTLLARAGHEVTFSYARSGLKLARLARRAGRSAHSGTVREAVQRAETVLLAVHWSRLRDVLGQAGDLSGKVVVTCSLPMNAADTELL